MPAELAQKISCLEAGVYFYESHLLYSTNSLACYCGLSSRGGEGRSQKKGVKEVPEMKVKL